MVGCSLVYKTFKRLFLFRCDSMHSIAKTCLPGCPDAWLCPPTLLFLPDYHCVNPLPPPTSPLLLLLQRFPRIPCLSSFCQSSPASCLHFKLMDLPRRDKERKREREREREKWTKKRQKKSEGEKKRGSQVKYAYIRHRQSLCLWPLFKEVCTFRRLREHPAAEHF